jgi:hypothetical protein
MFFVIKPLKDAIALLREQLEGLWSAPMAQSRRLRLSAAEPIGQSRIGTPNGPALMHYATGSARGGRGGRHRDTSAAVPADTPAVMAADISVVVKSLEAAIATLREQLEHANGRAQQAEKQVATAENRANRAENRASGAEEGALSERNRADLGEAGRDAAEIRANRAEQTLTAERNRADELRGRRPQRQTGRRAGRAGCGPGPG